ncbi:hypothetical protein [Paraperlucidibaca sp.]|uniref:hypothetical protein n=1 Tax=Paraperlucidibaca sp. TaxID=2708021 RepID=UPI0030F3C983
MKVIYFYEERMRRQNKKSRSLIVRMARALRDGYAISPDLELAPLLGYQEELSNEGALERFIVDELQVLDEQLAQSIFSALCDRLQRRLTLLPLHMQGGLL